MSQAEFVPNACCKTIEEAWSCEGCCPDKAAYESAWQCAYPDYSDAALRLEIERSLAIRGLT